MTAQNNRYGIAGKKAPEFDVKYWIDGEGKETDQIYLSDFKGKVVVIYGFQSWCPGCHSRGLPALKQMVNELGGEEGIQFLAVQTVFEGAHTNTKEKLLVTQEKYDIPIPFGHDPGDETTRNRSNILHHYRTGGTPWFIIIDKEGSVFFNDYHLNVDKTIEVLREML